MVELITDYKNVSWRQNDGAEEVSRMIFITIDYSVRYISRIMVLLDGPMKIMPDSHSESWQNISRCVNVLIEEQQAARLDHTIRDPKLITLLTDSETTYQELIYQYKTTGFPPAPPKRKNSKRYQQPH